MAAPGNRDRRLMLWLSGVVVLVILAVSLFAPMEANNDPRPTTYNTAPGGAKAAFLTLERIGRPPARWNQTLDDLSKIDAPHTTLVLTEPAYTALEKDQLSASVKHFLERGGRVLATGSEAALLLPGGSSKSSRRFGKLCYTDPEGPGRLARAGHVEMNDAARWGDERPAVFVEQRCGPDAVVVRMPYGHGEAIWWSSASPLTNAELHNDADLRLLLASLGDGRRVLFDESLHQPLRTQWSTTRGLPLWWMLGQVGVVFALLAFSFSRRREPIRLPVTVPRSSPLEFAVSMGDLYEKAGATSAATEAARRRLERSLVREAGLASSTLRAGSAEIVHALEQRFPGNWQKLGALLDEAAERSETNPAPRSALLLTRAMQAEVERVRKVAHPAVPPGVEGDAAVLELAGTGVQE